MTVNAINGIAFTSLSAVAGRTLSTLAAINGQTIAGGVGTNVLAAQVLEIQKEESASDVGASPDLLQIEVFE